MTVALLDDFNRANGAPGANWAQAVNAYSLPDIVSNALDYPAFPSGHWATSFPADQGAYVELVTAETIYLLLRWANPNTGTENGYIVYGSWGGSQPAEAWVRVAGVDTSLGFFNGVMQATDKWIKAEAQGSTLRIYGSADGSAWAVRQTWTDSTFSNAGYVGIYNPNNSTPGSINNFGGGALGESSDVLVARTGIGMGRW